MRRDGSQEGGGTEGNELESTRRPSLSFIRRLPACLFVPTLPPPLLPPPPFLFFDLRRSSARNSPIASWQHALKEKTDVLFSDSTKHAVPTLKESCQPIGSHDGASARDPIHVPVKQNSPIPAARSCSALAVTLPPIRAKAGSARRTRDLCP